MSLCLLRPPTSKRLSKKEIDIICMDLKRFKKCIQVLFMDIALSSSSTPTVLQRLQFSLLFKVASLFWHQFLFGSHWAASCLISKDDVTAASGILEGRCKTREGKEWDRMWWWALMFLRSFYQTLQLDSVIRKVLTMINEKARCNSQHSKDSSIKFLKLYSIMTLWGLNLRSMNFKPSTYACILCTYSLRRLCLCFTILLWNLDMSVKSHLIHLGIIAPSWQQGGAHA